MTLTVPILVNSLLGVHARPSAVVVKAVNKFSATVEVAKDGEVVNGASIMGLMMLAAGPGAVLQVRAAGRDAEKLVSALSDLADYGFGDYIRRIDDIYSCWKDLERQSRY